MRQRIGRRKGVAGYFPLVADVLLENEQLVVGVWNALFDGLDGNEPLRVRPYEGPLWSGLHNFLHSQFRVEGDRLKYAVIRPLDRI